jgi:hypothetical protein
MKVRQTDMRAQTDQIKASYERRLMEVEESLTSEQ